MARPADIIGVTRRRVGPEHKLTGVITTRARMALAAGASARWASRVTGRGAGAMIGGLIAMTLDRSVLRQLAAGRRTVIVTGTNGKSTTTRMTSAALETLGAVATNAEGANMDAGLVAALAAKRQASLAALDRGRPSGRVRGCNAG
jgi:UDP-N-acetylmuramyl tripeptide synthase